MAKLPRLTARQAEKLLIQAGFAMVRSKGSHRMFMRGDRRVVVPFHGRRTLHPKVVKQMLKTIEDAQAAERETSCNSG